MHSSALECMRLCVSCHCTQVGCTCQSARYIAAGAGAGYRAGAVHADRRKRCIIDRNLHIAAGPHLWAVHAGGLCHGVMLVNSNGMDVVLTSNTLQFRAIGGILDLYFLMGPTPMDVLNQMTSIVGRPVMPPYWSLGLMQSK